MCKTELEKLESDLKAYGKQVTSNKKNSEEFLQKIGVTTRPVSQNSIINNRRYVIVPYCVITPPRLLSRCKKILIKLVIISIQPLLMFYKKIIAYNYVNCML